MSVRHPRKRASMRPLHRLSSAVAAVLVAVAAAPASAAPASAQERAGEVRLNQIQVIGSHNSYHAGLTPAMAKLIAARDPDAAASLDYSHGDLKTQLDHGVRQVELDVFADAKGGRFAHPFGATLAGPGAPAFDPDRLMAKPGFKVMHVQDFDYLSTCQPFTGCLRTIRDWSRAHPGHAPIFVLVETKAPPPLAGTPMVSTEPFTPAVLDALDAEIRSVFPQSEMITPDQVRGRHATLEQAALAGDWPTLRSARGKVVFLLDQKDVGPAYLAGHPSLNGRVLFTNADPGQPDAAFVEANDADEAAITALVRRGYLVRTRSDADTKQARTGDTARRDAVLRSGAQIVSTDYPAFEPSRWTGYAVALPGDAAVRCNPVNAPKSCVDANIERPPAL